MKQKLLFVFSLLCVLCLGANAQDKTEKFYLGVTGYDGTTPETVDATVYDDYSFVVKLPETDADGKCYIGADKATIDIKMTNVASLGVSGTRSASKTLETGISGVSADLAYYLSNAYGFQGVTCPVTVKDATTSQNFTYNIAATDNFQLVGTPSSTPDARAAWQLLASKVTATTKSEDDSFFGFKKGTYVRLGDESLVFDADLDLLKGAWTIDGIFTDVENAVHIEKNVCSGSETYKPMAYIPAGSVLSLSNSMATLNENATLTVDGTAAYSEGNELSGVISTYRTQMNNDTKMAILLFMQLFNQTIQMVDAADNVPVTLEFAKPTGHLKVYAATETAIDGVSPYAYESQYQPTTRNAIAIVESQYADEAEGLTNVLIEYTVGKTGKYYECENFVLTDKEDFYSPVDFTALAGSYTRTIDQDGGEYFSTCLPFAISSADINGTIMTFSSYSKEDGVENVYFTERTQIDDAGTPCIVKVNSRDAWNIDLAGREISANPITATNMQGSYTKQTLGTGHYKLNNDGTKFVNTIETSTITPFRSYLDIDKDHAFESKAINAIWGEETDAINALVTDENTIEAIYTVGGAQLSKMQNGVNIVKMKDGSVRKITIK